MQRIQEGHRSSCFGYCCLGLCAWLRESRTQKKHHRFAGGYCVVQNKPQVPHASLDVSSWHGPVASFAEFEEKNA
jgi:hypothetical protein